MNIKLLTALRKALEVFPAERFDYNAIPTKYEVGGCGCLMIVGREAGVLPNTTLWPRDLTELLGMSAIEVDELFNAWCSIPLEYALGQRGKVCAMRNLDKFRAVATAENSLVVRDEDR